MCWCGLARWRRTGPKERLVMFVAAAFEGTRVREEVNLG
jgi:hypothetical protein